MGISGPMQGGIYNIKNVAQSSQYLTLFNQSDIIKGANKDSSNKQKWIVDDQGNDTFVVSNNGFDAKPKAYSAAATGSNVKGSDNKVAWKITELNPGIYRIVVSGYAWSLESDGIKLATIDSADDKQSFIFEKV